MSSGGHLVGNFFGGMISLEEANSKQVLNYDRCKTNTFIVVVVVVVIVVIVAVVLRYLLCFCNLQEFEYSLFINL